MDELWAAFVDALPGDLRDAALGLAATLGLAPSRDVPWSEVFSNEITLGAPILVAEAMPGLPEAAVRDAALAHQLAIVEAFATDRLEDGQAEPTAALHALLAAVRAARDASLARVAPGMTELGTSYARAEQETLAAIRAEQEALRGGSTVAFERYLAIAHGKQRVGLPASIALAHAAGWDGRRVRCLARLLDDVWVGLQLHDDVIDWEDDLTRGGAWATAVAAEAVPEAAPPPSALPPSRDSSERRTMPFSARGLVHRSGVLARMLGASSRRFRAARRRATHLGATRLAAWAGEREALTGGLARREAESPGFANRAHALSVWAKSVLS